jgi:hypothetical protein
MTAKLLADGDPTEVALAELYAFVQSQPESEVKKKWVHKFNKENGCGTPKVILNSRIRERHQSFSKISNGLGISRKLTHSIRVKFISNQSFMSRLPISHVQKHLFHGASNGSLTLKSRQSKSTGPRAQCLLLSYRNVSYIIA